MQVDLIAQVRHVRVDLTHPLAVLFGQQRLPCSRVDDTRGADHQKGITIADDTLGVLPDFGRQIFPKPDDARAQHPAAVLACRWRQLGDLLHGWWTTELPGPAAARAQRGEQTAMYV